MAVAQALRNDPHLSVAEIWRQLGVSETTFYRHTKAQPQTQQPQQQGQTAEGARDDPIGRSG